jgi:threonine/homoserine/homoserine lactone efflux protein
MLEIAGLELLPAWPVFLAFVAAGLALNIVPGADMTFIVASAARGGRRDGVIHAPSPTGTDRQPVAASAAGFVHDDTRTTADQIPEG